MATIIKKRVEIDALKGIAIFLVVLGHSIVFYPINMHDNAACDFLFRWLSSVHMPLFFVVSGFCFSYKTSYRDYIYKKIKRILVPYIVFNLLDTLPRYLFSNLVNRPRNIEDSIYRMVFQGGEYWFLYTLFIIFLLFPFVYRIFSNKGFGVLVLIGIIVLNYLIPTINIFNASSVLNYSVYFGTGVYINNCFGNRIFNYAPKLLLIPLSVLWILLIWLNNDSARFLTAFIGIIVMFLFTKFDCFNKIFARFGEYSLQIYLLNGFMLVISRTIAIKYMHLSNYFIIIGINMLIDFFLSYWVIKKMCSKSAFIQTIMGV